LDTLAERHTVFVVDDAPFNLIIISDILKDNYKIITFESGEEVLDYVEPNPVPDLILLDIILPGMNGYEVCQKLKENIKTKDIPVIFLTSIRDQGNEERGFKLGAVNYITKPINRAILHARVDAQIRLKEARDFLHDKNKFLENEVKKRTKATRLAQKLVIFALATLSEIRDYETGNHIRRTNLYVSLLALQLSKTSKYKDILTDNYVNLLYESASLHDIGKIGISDTILLKPGKLTTEEFEIMKTHTTIGRDALLKAEENFNSKVAMLQCAKRIAYSHHEKWDGSGYPEGLSGQEIPLCGRIMAVADVYDALRSKRVYKPPFPHKKVSRMLIDDSGKHFDPEIIEAFLKISNKFEKISNKYQD